MILIKRFMHKNGLRDSPPPKKILLKSSRNIPNIDHFKALVFTTKNPENAIFHKKNLKKHPDFHGYKYCRISVQP